MHWVFYLELMAILKNKSIGFQLEANIFVGTFSFVRPGTTYSKTEKNKKNVSHDGFTCPNIN